jgi:hypothetical protein
VVELRRAARLHDGDVVGDGSDVRDHLRKLGAGLAVARELIAGAEHGGVGPDERVALSVDDGRRQRLAFELGQLGLVVEELELRGRARHEEMDDGLGLGRMVGQAGDLAGAGGGEAAHGAVGHQGGEGDLADAEGALLEEVPAGDVGAGRHG